MGLLKDKTVLITGASRGIGHSIAKMFAAEGADIAFSYRSSLEKAKALEEVLAGEGIKAKAYQSDAGSFEDAGNLVNSTIEDFGKIDVLINNAGITKDNLILRMSEEDWDAVININLKSMFNLTKHVVRPMMKARSGSIINMSSIIGLNGQAGQSNYAASKAGIIGFTKSIAKEMGSRNIRCNAIAPGFIETDMTQELSADSKEQFIKDIPLKRLGQPEEVAGACVFLASDLSSYVTGQVISVCGALSL